MNDDPVNLLYLAYGNTKYIYETVYSILSLIKINADYKRFHIVIYTDNESEFKKLIPNNFTVIYEHLDDDKKFQWSNQNKYIYRMKLEVLIDCLKKYKKKCLFIDTDTYFVKNNFLDMVQSIDNEHFIMHIDENTLEERYYANKEIIIDAKTQNIETNVMDYLRKNPVILKDGTELMINFKLKMWNSGVIGVDYSAVPILEQALFLVDEIYSKFEFRIVEQFAISVLLQIHGTIKALDSCIIHYWYYKPCKYLLVQYYTRMPRISKHINDIELKKMLSYEKDAIANNTIKKYIVKKDAITNNTATNDAISQDGISHDINSIITKNITESNPDFDEIFDIMISKLHEYWDKKFLLVWCPPDSMVGKKIRSIWFVK